MRINRRLVITGAVCLTLLSFPVPQGQAQFAVACVNCSDNVTQWAMAAKQVLQYIKEAQTALQAVAMAQQMVREGVQLAEHPSTNIVADLGMLSTILVQSQGLAGSMAQMDNMFRGTYQAYSPTPLGNFSQQYNNWAGTTLRTLNAAVNAAGYQGGMLQNENLWMQKIQLMNQSAQGRNESLQLGNTVAIAEVGQLQALRQLMLSDMTAKSAFMAQQTSVAAAEQSAVHNAFGFAPPVVSGKIW